MAQQLKGDTRSTGAVSQGITGSTADTGKTQSGQTPMGQLVTAVAASDDNRVQTDSPSGPENTRPKLDILMRQISNHSNDGKDSGLVMSPATTPTTPPPGSLVLPPLFRSVSQQSNEQAPGTQDQPQENKSSKD
ncbi:hypothetical protein [Parendozoicomonas haliclonae]|uniref:Uncharacterized protein n=1 Tax=Parendozoicomonas haliclonae TaxID=1960125 RepID=A0A1X7APL2_9GAMM|nr:hypothetical protein [Parendozoicomonas haliclonae]SMA50226.1 hypothetical protein EHSB41UT_04019 [Parendozoicomonas haliclonae]